VLDSLLEQLGAFTEVWIRVARELATRNGDNSRGGYTEAHIDQTPVVVVDNIANGSGDTWWRCHAQDSFDIARILNQRSHQWLHFTASEDFTQISACKHKRASCTTFYTSETYYVKVHEFCVHDQDKHWVDAASAFLESSATSYVCKLEGWWCSTFGIMCGSGPNEKAYVFIARHKLMPTSTGRERIVRATDIFYQIARRRNVLHNDVHQYNVMMLHGVLQAIDFERASLLQPPDSDSDVWAHIKSFYKWYCLLVCNPQQYPECNRINALMVDQLRYSGLDATHGHFAQIFKNRSFRKMAFDSDAFSETPVSSWNYCAWLHILHDLDSQGLNPTLIAHENESVQEFRIHAVVRRDITCVISFTLDSHRGGAVRIASAYATMRGKDTRHLRRSQFPTSPDGTDPWHLLEFGITHRFVTTALNLFGIEGSSTDAAGDGDECCDDDDGSDIEVMAVTIGRPAEQASADAYVPVNHTKILQSFTWAISEHPYPTPQHFHDHRQHSLISSFRRRFPTLMSTFEQLAPPGIRVVEVQQPRNALTLTQLRARCVVVNSGALERECTAFCQQATWIAIDTETAPMNSGCDLVQIGRDELVYLVAVATRRQFLVGIANLLANDTRKTVFQFGSDDFQKFIGQMGVSTFRCTVKDIKGTRQISLTDLYAENFGVSWVLSKAWRISGWDNPVLQSQQEEYAALDVVCLSKLAKTVYPQLCEK
jgi:hypothetical protein